MGLKLKFLKHVYTDITARNAIIAGDRFEGMTVTVLDNGSGIIENYRLEGGIDNGDWSSTITTGSITLAMMANLAADTIIGRANGAGTGVPTALTAAQVRTIINVENGADVTDATNVNAAGATMNTDSSLSGNSYFIDEDTMVSDDDTKVPSQQSVKAYVDATSSSAKAYQGGYNASTNSPDLTTPIAGIVSGDVWDVEVAGTFLGESLEIGDTLTAKQATPTLIAHWFIGQTNMTAASTKTLYESNANTNEYSDAEETKLGYLTLTGAKNLDNIEDNADVTDATNVNAAGAVMNTDTTTTAMDFVIDEDSMASNLATKVPTQQSVKTYVDAQVFTLPAGLSNVVAAVGTTSGTTPTSLWTKALSDESQYFIDAWVMARQDLTTPSARSAYHIAAMIYREGGGVPIINNVVSDIYESNASLDASFVQSSNNVVLEVTGLISIDMDWDAWITVRERTDYT